MNGPDDVVDNSIPVMNDDDGVTASSDSSDVATLKAELQSLTEELEQAKTAAAQARDGQLRSQADYQNLIRRTQEDKIKFVKMANKELVASLLQPLDHLALAAEQLKDKGLDMVLKQLWTALNDQGLEEITVVGKKFDDETMEVVEKKGDGDKVVSVVKKGYRLNGDVIQHAKVIVE